jgi:hypothetical protein
MISLCRTIGRRRERIGDPSARLRHARCLEEGGSLVVLPAVAGFYLALTESFV